MSLVKEIRESLLFALNSILGDPEEADWLLAGVKADELRLRYREKVRPLALVSFDVDKIKDFVFSSAKPLEISGASEMVKDLTRLPQNGIEAPYCSVYRVLEEEGLSAKNIVFAGGGTGMLIVPAARAEKLASEIRSRFARTSGTGSCTTTWRAFFPHELILGPDITDAAPLFPGVKHPVEGEGFARVLRLMADELREKKEEKMAAILPLPGYIARCLSCGIRAATQPDTRAWVEELLCESCFGQRERGRVEKNALEGQLLEMAQSIDDIVGEDAERGYVGVIHADADKMGRKLMQMKSIDDLALFSNIVTRTMEDVRTRLIAGHGLSRQYQAPIVGGDDILLIVPAHKTAVMVADLLCKVKEVFASWALQLPPGKKELGVILKEITMSVGFVIVPARYHIRFSVDCSENLLAQAKKMSHGGEGGCVDFAVITDGTPLHTEIAVLRERFYTRYSEKWHLNLTARPLRAPDFEDLLNNIRLLKKKIAGSQLKILEGFLFSESPEAARMNILYQWIRVADWWDDIFGRNHNRMEEWLNRFLLKELSNRNGVRSYCSGITELTELFDFMEAGA